MTDWYSAHVYYYDREQTDLLLDAVRPVFAEIEAAEGVSRCYWQRHWRLGPHVRLNVRATPDAWAGRVRPLIDKVIGDHLRRHPSTGTASEERDLPVHRQLAELEQEHGPLTPWQPDNSIRYAEYDRRLHVLGTVESSDLLADFHTDTTPLAFAALDLARSTGDRFDIPVTFMFATAARGCPPIERGFLSYRSHAEGFLANSSDPAGFRERFERLYRSNAETLRRQLTRVLEALAEGGEPAIQLADWVALVEKYRDRALELHRAGNLVLQPVVSPAEVAEGPAVPFANVSPFHRALLGNDEIRTELATAEWFAVYRVLLNYQYLLFNRLGVAPVERFTLCYLAARTVEETYKIVIPEIFDPADLIAGSAREGR
jgi:Lantibiotic biosynthesis dehydratase C-term